MNDLKDLLELALSDVPGRDARVDPAADLARGRLLLRRRRQRLAGLAGVTAAVLCGVLVPLALQGSAPSHRPAPVAVDDPSAAESLTAGSHRRARSAVSPDQAGRVGRDAAARLPGGLDAQGLGGPGQHSLRAGHGAA